MIRLTRDVIAAVRELMERHLDVIEISAKLKIDPSQVQAAIDLINNLLTLLCLLYSVSLFVSLWMLHSMFLLLAFFAYC